MIDAILQQITVYSSAGALVRSQSRLGVHKSRQRGTGLEFDQIREYRDGEPIRKINWAATARKGGDIPFINRYYEEKDLTLMLLVDMSASMDFGSVRLTKKSSRRRDCRSLVYSALAGHDRVGRLGFVSGWCRYVPLRQYQSVSTGYSGEHPDLRTAQSCSEFFLPRDFPRTARETSLPGLCPV